MSDSHSGTIITHSGLKQPYHLVDPSPWPIVGALFGALLLFGIVIVAHYGNYTPMIIGIIGVLGVMFFWWRDVLKEAATPANYSPVVGFGLRYGMALFILSEVMFFVAFFWAFFHYALFPEHVLGVTGPHVWPPAGVKTFDPFHLPFLNTMILLLSGCTVTWAHHSLLQDDRKGLLVGLALTVLLGVSFTTFQIIEYSNAPFHLWGGLYPGVFFLATGFHGFHVIVGTTFLAVCFLRAQAGGFTRARHFGFEAAAWYWHFVDVVWLFLFVCIYWWGHGVIVME